MPGRCSLHQEEEEERERIRLEKEKREEEEGMEKDLPKAHSGAANWRGARRHGEVGNFGT